MIAYIKGKVIDEFEGGVVLENNGIGYEILCSAQALLRLSAQKEGGVYTYFQVKEDGVSLYGFDTKAEKSMFLKLITVSGVGPKIGIAVLSGMNINDLATTIATADVKTLSKIKGLGKKTAERIILELRENVEKDVISVLTGPEINVPVSKEDEDAVIALTGLGFTSTESKNAVKAAREAGAKTIEEVIASSLRSLNR
ncbi:MAG TPA: Holliday junction branch migration protein RuvA [Clostridiales bacterium]|nr:Holliday junction branch migration protein RuvA [Clostridiales bacterium]